MSSNILPPFAFTPNIEGFLIIGLTSIVKSSFLELDPDKY